VVPPDGGSTGYSAGVPYGLKTRSEDNALGRKGRRRVPYRIVAGTYTARGININVGQSSGETRRQTAVTLSTRG